MAEGIEIQLLLTRRPDVSDTAFREAVGKAGGRETAFRLPADALPAIAHISESGSSDPIPDAIVTLADGADPAAVVAGLAPVADVTLFAALRRTILPGAGPIRLFFAFRRPAGMTREACHDYWYNVHADFGRRLIPPHSYYQMHARDLPAPVAGAEAATYDGLVEVHFPDIPAFVDQLSRPEVSSGALEDERNFIDHARSIFWVYSVA